MGTNTHTWNLWISISAPPPCRHFALVLLLVGVTVTVGGEKRIIGCPLSGACIMYFSLMSLTCQRVWKHRLHVAWPVNEPSKLLHSNTRLTLSSSPRCGRDRDLSAAFGQNRWGRVLSISRSSCVSHVGRWSPATHPTPHTFPLPPRAKSHWELPGPKSEIQNSRIPGFHERRKRRNPTFFLTGCATWVPWTNAGLVGVVADDAPPTRTSTRTHRRSRRGSRKGACIYKYNPPPRSDTNMEMKKKMYMTSKKKTKVEKSKINYG